MLHETIVNIIRRKNLPESEQLLSRKWRQVVASVDWLTSQFRTDSEYQIYMFNNVSVPVIKGTDGLWLKADDADQLDDAVRTLRPDGAEERYEHVFRFSGHPGYGSAP